MSSDETMNWVKAGYTPNQIKVAREHALSLSVAESLQKSPKYDSSFKEAEAVVVQDGSLFPEPRLALRRFASVQEAKLQRNDHKTGWHTLPVEALFRLLQIEIEEFKVAMEFLSVAEARNESIDIANFAMILWDRLSTEDQKAKVGK